MKKDWIKSNNRGVATLEILLAMAIIVMTLSVTLMLSFINQSVLVDGQTNREALNKAEELLEESQALGSKDYRLVNPVSSTTDDIYEKSIYVSNLDYFTKK